MKYSEYEKLKCIKSVIYDVSIMEYMGKMKIKKKLKENFILIIFFIMGIFLLFFLSRVIFSVEVVHSDREIRELLVRELSKYHIEKFYFKKSYKELEIIENNILERNRDRLEWIEITESGTKYIVRVEERKISSLDNNNRYQHIVSKKDAVIVSVKAISGEKVKSVNDYVKKGDIIISGNINDVVKKGALGEVLGEVWYTVKIDYPFVYEESILTGKYRNAYGLYFFGKRFGFMDRFRSFYSKKKVIFSFNLLDIYFVKEKQYERIVKDEVNTLEVVTDRAIEYVLDKLKKDNADIKDVSLVEVLSSYSDEDSIHLNLFVKTIEDIGVPLLMEEE